ncbi:uncharacterized protein LOC122253530 [Penaeus japonicus]|uniref:uncharacterized protein LOC122253530 n=1 Tax=Penaeus japonicus TaxID=27405 RepID=UPI001C713645|nr:uncharacterized protein LOC122253530 [Penaeus japonicus]XP_042872765.1 uncharacterized protein LOC122253530 [Penaeus japonicus]
MKDLLMLLMLATAMMAVQACKEKGECHNLIKTVMHKENMTDTIKTCMLENEIMPNLKGVGRGRGPGGRRRGGGRGKRSPRMMRFMDALSPEDQATLTECIFEKEDLLTDEGLFDATQFVADVVTKLEEEDETPETLAMLAAIENGDCVLEEGDPDLGVIFEFIKCLKEECEAETDPEAEEI